jgi:AbrB family looped-hinge helix DNA binding protein
MQEYVTKVGAKGQIVIPKKLREKHMLDIGKQAVIFEDVDGTIRIVSKVKISDIKININLDVRAVKKEIEKMREEWY